MPWAAYADVLALLGTAEAERIATQSGASDSETWWDARIASAAAFAIGALRGSRYLVPEDPSDLSTNDGLMLAQGIAEQAILSSRPFNVRAGSQESPPPEIGPTLRAILSGTIRLDLGGERLFEFIPAEPLADDQGVDFDNPASIVRAASRVF